MTNLNFPRKLCKKIFVYGFFFCNRLIDQDNLIKGSTFVYIFYNGQEDVDRRIAIGFPTHTHNLILARCT